MSASASASKWIACAWLIGSHSLMACLDLDEPTLASGEIGANTTISLTLNYNASIRPAAVQQADFVAYQDGNGPWRAMPLQAGKYTATIASDRYGLAIGYRSPPPDSRATVKVLYQTVFDRTETVTLGPMFEPQPYSLILLADGFDLVSLGGSVGFPFPGMPLVIPARQLTNNLFAWKQENVVAGDGVIIHKVTKLVRMSRVDLDMTPVISLDASLPFPDPIPHAVSLNHGTMTGTVASRWRNALANEAQSLGTSRHETFSLPASLVRAQDFYSVSCTFDAAPGATSYNSSYDVGSPDHLDLVPGPSFTLPAPQLLTAPYPRPVATFTAVSGGLPYVDYTLRFNSSISGYEISASQAWLGGPSVTLAMPDFSGLPGWTTDLQPPMRTPLSWSVARSEYNLVQPAPAIAFNHAPGAIFYRATQSGTIGAYCGNGIVEPAFEQCEPPGTATCSATCQRQAAVTELH